MRGLRRRLQADGIDTLLVNIHGQDGAALRQRFGFQLSPTCLVFDAGGDEVWRANTIPSRGRVLDALE